MFKKLFSSQLRINMLSGSATTIVNIIVMAIGYPIYLHFLGYEQYGVWLVLTTVLSFASLGNLGIGTAVMKLVAEEYGRKNIQGVQSYITTALVMLLLSGTIILLVLLILRHPIVASFKLNTENAYMVQWLLPYIGVLCIYSFFIQVFEATLSGLGHMDWANYIRTFSHVMQVLISGLLLASGQGIIGMLIGSIVSCIIIHILAVFCIRKIIRFNLLNTATINADSLKIMIKFGGTVFSGTLISMLLNPFNKLMLSRYAGVATLPVYEIAFTGAMYVRSLIEAGMRALLPEISHISSNLTHQAKEQMQNIYERSLNLILKYGTPIYAFLLLVAPFIFQFWFGKRYVETMPTSFRLMLVGSFLNLLGVPAYYTLMGTNKVSSCLVAHVIQSFINFILVIAIVIFVDNLNINQVVLATILGLGCSALYLIITMRITLTKS
jgi:O-antigen/teichoic acid export membrane protein